MRDFRGAGICIGQGDFKSGETRQAVKLALLLTNPDGAAYSPLCTKILFDASDAEIAEKSQGLVTEGRKHEFDNLCIYLAGRLQNTSTGWHLQGNGGERPRMSLEAIASVASDIRSKSTVIFFDLGGSAAPATQDFVSHLQRFFSQLSRPTAVILGVEASTDSPHLQNQIRWRPDGSSPNVPGLGALATSQSPNELLLEWLVGRDTPADAAINVQSLQEDAALAKNVQLEAPLADETKQIRLGARFPWLIWSRRTTIPGHAVRSLHNFVDQNCEAITSRIRDEGFSRNTLAGLPVSLYSAMWQEAFEGKDLDLMDRLERDRNILKGALRANGFNRSATATAMGISRSTLYAKLRRLNISIDQLRNGNHP